MFFYVMLMDFQKLEVSILEYILMVWVGVLIIEEVRQVGLMLFLFYILPPPPPPPLMLHCISVQILSLKKLAHSLSFVKARIFSPKILD